MSQLLGQVQRTPQSSVPGALLCPQQLSMQLYTYSGRVTTWVARAASSSVAWRCRAVSSASAGADARELLCLSCRFSSRSCTNSASRRLACRVRAITQQYAEAQPCPQAPRGCSRQQQAHELHHHPTEPSRAHERLATLRVPKVCLRESATGFSVFVMSCGSSSADMERGRLSAFDPRCRSVTLLRKVAWRDCMPKCRQVRLHKWRVLCSWSKADIQSWAKPCIWHWHVALQLRWEKVWPTDSALHGLPCSQGLHMRSTCFAQVSTSAAPS